MDADHAYSNISLQAIPELVDKYPSVVPAKVTEGKESLDDFRYRILPARIAERAESPAGAFIDDADLSQLMKWKLAHGKFRPNLQKLADRNEKQRVIDTSKDAFQSLEKGGDVKKAFDILCRLQGVGPATASLVVSVYYPEKYPFFSDELFRWCFFEPGGGKGWDRKIGYSVKEYLQLFDKVGTLKSRLGGDGAHRFSCFDVERAAYVLGRSKALGESAGSKPAAESTVTSKKRKAEGEVMPSEKHGHGRQRTVSKASGPTRKSARLKK